MEAEFWHKLWESNNIGFHNKEVNKLFLKNFIQLDINKESRVFIPLCGKTVDIKWLLDHSYSVVGAELNENAIIELFNYLKLEPTIKTIGSLTLYSSTKIDIYVGDIFELDKSILGNVDIIYDRGAIVALPSAMRERYTSFLASITENTPQLVICYEYNQNLMDGPPFSVKESQLKDYYSEYYDFKLMAAIKPKAFSELEMSETVWYLSSNSI